ncbi:MFS transporter [Aliiroseovarius sp. KMU-50]|uniref:Multidrug efflux pump Tap n=1 Tax=Aliiroseovarius salicola TaxID=3009082 RepID=A0ABT4W4H1_9RHOB|nr:MFS transporter [Aliiroseovarius sp. KMU-50]MDA5095413.1 MFS transporter [Aliiroseovarius sp. KMU-50]
MLGILRNRTYRHLFGAQVVALTGTGLATVALALLAFELAGDQAALVLGTALTIKMIAYVLIAPMAAALAERIPRRRVLVALDVIRAAVAVFLPFVTEVWQVYLLIFLLQSASAGFTPMFQATIPDVLPKDEDYTKALSLSRLAMDLESLLSPLLAALILGVTGFATLFWGTSLGFLASAVLVVSVVLPTPKPTTSCPIWKRTTRGLTLYLKTPRLRGLLALCWASSSTGAMVFVNTVLLVKSELGLGDAAVALALGSFGLGSMAAALLLPQLIRKWEDRSVMITGATIGTISLLGFGLATSLLPLTLGLLMVFWVGVGIGFSAILTPSGRVLSRSAHAFDRPAIFAAHFTLSHACWLIAYPLSGFLMTELGGGATSFILAILAGLGGLTAMYLWPRNSSDAIVHHHDDLPPDHPHLSGEGPHAHAIIIDDLHPHFPTRG